MMIPEPVASTACTEETTLQRGRREEGRRSALGVPSCCACRQPETSLQLAPMFPHRGSEPRGDSRTPISPKTFPKPQRGSGCPPGHLHRGARPGSLVSTHSGGYRTQRVS